MVEQIRGVASETPRIWTQRPVGIAREEITAEWTRRLKFQHSRRLGSCASNCNLPGFPKCAPKKHQHFAVLLPELQPFDLLASDEQRRTTFSVGLRPVRGRNPGLLPSSAG